MKLTAHTHLKIKLCISGAAETGHCAPDALDLTKELGRQIVKQGAILVTGATTGAPLWGAIGAKEVGGFVIGLSPASSEQEHVKKYKLPIDYHDIIVYTGFGYAGRNLLLTRASDALLITCGRVGTINEFTIAFEDEKPVGVLTSGGWMTDDVIKKIIDEGHRGPGKVVYDSDPKRLVEKVLELVKKEKIVDIPFRVASFKKESRG